MGLNIAGTFQLCKLVPWEKLKRMGLASWLWHAQKLMANSYFLSSQSKSSFGGKGHCLLVIENSIDYMWSYSSKDKPKFKTVMMTFLSI